MTTLEEFLNYCDTVKCSEAEYERYIRENMSDFVRFYNNSWKHLFEAVMNVKYGIEQRTLTQIAEEGDLLEYEIAEELQRRLIFAKDDSSSSSDSESTLSDSSDDEGEMISFLKGNNKFTTDKQIISRKIPQSLLGDIDDPVDEYVEEVTNYLAEQELKELPKNKSWVMKDFGPRMYMILADWLTDVEMKLKLSKETSEITRYMIRYCLCDDEFINLGREKLQLLGVVCSLIASKTEEKYHPDIHDYVYITDRGYTTYEIRNMEKRVLKAIQFHVNFVTPRNFIRLFSRLMANLVETHTLTFYIVASALNDIDMIIRFLPSEIAAGAIFLAKKSKGEFFAWNENLMRISYSRAQEIAIFLITNVKYLQETNKLLAVKRMYGTDKFLKVSDIPLKL